MPAVQPVSCSIAFHKRISNSIVTNAHVPCILLSAGILLLSCSHSPCTHAVSIMKNHFQDLGVAKALKYLSVAHVSYTCCDFFMLLICRGQLWGSLRAGAQPMFHSANLSTYAGTINKAVDALITKLHAVARTGREVNIFQPLGQMTLQVTGVAAFGWVCLAHSCFSAMSTHGIAGACMQHFPSQLFKHHESGLEDVTTVSQSLQTGIRQTS
jgi:hypothetical protein